MYSLLYSYPRNIYSGTCSIWHLSFPTSCNIWQQFMVQKYFYWLKKTPSIPHPVQSDTFTRSLGLDRFHCTCISGGGWGLIININVLQWKFKDTKGVIRSLKSKEQTLQLPEKKPIKDTQWSRNHDIENQRSYNTKSTKNPGLKQNYIIIILLKYTGVVSWLLIF